MTKTRRFVRRLVTCVVFLLALVVAVSPAASAYEATNYTYTISADGDWLRTQDAYLVSNVILKEAKLSSPSDMIIKNDVLYVADTGNARIYAENIKTGESKIYGEGYLQNPTGVFVNDEGFVFVADTGVKAVLVFAPDGEHRNSYARPETATFGQNTQYIPAKVAVNDAGILYIVSEGSYDGMVQIDKEGNFLGYFGYNNNPMTVGDYLMEIFFTEEQKNKLLNRTPFSFGNLAMDEKGLVYSTTLSVEGNAVKRHDISGQNLLPTEMDDEKNFVDVAVGSYGQIYAVTQSGLVFEYDTDGNLLFSLGGLAIANERGGLISVASSVTTDEYGNVFVLDTERDIVHVLCPTAMATAVHEAMDLYNNGHYEESKTVWEHVSLIIGNSRISENGIANCLFQLEEYDAAAEHYRIAENRDGYSDSYWQIRSEQIKDIMPFLLAALVLLLIGNFIFGKYREKHPKKLREVSKFESDMKLILRTLRHPLDSFYDIRRTGAGSMISATVIYILAYAVFVCNFILRGFVVSFNTPENTSIVYVTVLFIVPVFLFIISNFFVGEINESEARFRDIYVATAYVTSPFVVIMPFVILISHFMTQAESRILGLITVAIYAWVVVLLWISTKEIHAYTVPRTIANLLITIFLMAVIILAASLIGMFWDQLLDFIISIIKEVQFRAT